VATELIQKLLERGDSHIYAVSTKPNILCSRYQDKKITVLSLDALSKRLLDKELDDIVAFVHCAFARSNNKKEIADSLDYLKKILCLVKRHRVGAFVNISSQGVYGQKHKPFWREETPADPYDFYTIGKYFSELLVNTALDGSDINFTNIRLASVSGNARFLNVFVENAFYGRPIKVVGGEQRCSFIDVRDVAEALILLIYQADQIKWKTVYNLGLGNNRTVNELAERVKFFFEQQYNRKVLIEKEKATLFFEIGMDNQLFCETFNWNPKFDYDDMIQSLLEFHS